MPNAFVCDSALWQEGMRRPYIIPRVSGRVSASLYLVTFMLALLLLAQLVCANVLNECLIERNDSKLLL